MWSTLGRMDSKQRTIRGTIAGVTAAVIIGAGAWGITGVMQARQQHDAEQAALKTAASQSAVLTQQAQDRADQLKAEQDAAIQAAVEKADADYKAQQEAEAAAAAQAAAEKAAAEQAAAQRAAQQRATQQTVQQPPAATQCPPGSLANSGTVVNGVRIDTSCFPEICFHITLPDPAHPECVTAFKP